MENEQKQKVEKRIKRAYRIRKHVRGKADKPRLTIFRSNAHLAAQLIDDENHKTLAAYSTLDMAMKKRKLNRKSKEAAREIGKILAVKAKELNISRVVFDRGWYKFHGVIAELANSAREAGLQF